jgi:tRNA U34 5-carboxymethylaminomethyl modifying enzyme MnmG/GidA
MDAPHPHCEKGTRVEVALAAVKSVSIDAVTRISSDLPLGGTGEGEVHREVDAQERSVPVSRKFTT